MPKEKYCAGHKCYHPIADFNKMETIPDGYASSCRAYYEERKKKRDEPKRKDKEYEKYLQFI